jgi:L-lactate dehydrogenase complex protein LldG
MSDARSEVLARIRAALGPDRTEPDVPRDYRRGNALARESAVELLSERLRDYRATVHQCTETELASTVRSVLADAGRIVVPPGLPPTWAPETATVDNGLSASELDGYDTVVTGCAAACAETGTIVLDAGPDQGRRAITLVPDRHVCIVRAEQVVATVPELLERLDPCRPLTLVSGPSATSDIELRRVEGVHGPRTLDVVLVSPASV